MPRLWTGILVTDSPRYEDWRNILQSDEVPIQNPKPSEASLGGTQISVYKLDLDRLDRQQLDRLLTWVADRFGVKRSAAQSELEANGFPIREADVTVCFDMRAFI